MNDQDRCSFLTAAVIFNTMAELVLEMAEKHNVPAPAEILDGYSQLSHAFEHDDPSNLDETELEIFAAIRDRIAGHG